jgi:tyrosyl-tRNA synthetase
MTLPLEYQATKLNSFIRMSFTGILITGAKTVIIAKNLTLARTTRTLEIAGRKEGEAHYVSDYLYTPMQVADIFHMKVKICQLGMDQRKANMVGREIGEKIGCWKPVCVHHHLLQGLEKPSVWRPRMPRKKPLLQQRCLRANQKPASSSTISQRKSNRRWAKRFAQKE